MIGLILKAVGGWVVKNWRIVAVLAAVAGVVYGLRYIHDKIDQAGYNRCQGEHALAAAALVDQARESIVKTGAEYEKTIQNLASKGDTGHGVGDRTADALDRLRERAGR